MIDQIQLNFLAYFRLFIGLPSIVHEDSDITWFASRNPPPDNQVLRTQITNTDVEARIDHVLADIGQYTNQIDWLVFPSCQPADLGARLLARGMPSSLGGIWMYANLNNPLQHPPIPDDMQIELVRNTQMLAIWARVSSEGFGIDAQDFYTTYARYELSSEADLLHYIGFQHGQAVTSGTLLLAGGIAGLYDISTPPALRGHGFGTAMTVTLMDEAQRRGYSHAWLWASQMGQKTYSNVGFITQDFGVREYRWIKS